MCWSDESSDACWEGVRVGFRAMGLLEAPPPPKLLHSALSSGGLGAPTLGAPTQASLRR
jgi:hypothetical protein